MTIFHEAIITCKSLQESLSLENFWLYGEIEYIVLPFPSYRLTDVVRKKMIPSYVNNLVFEICEDGEDVEVPYIKYKFH